MEARGDFLRAVLAVWRAWTDAGRNPHYHRQVQAALAREWPTLHRALTDLDRACRRCAFGPDEGGR